MAVRQDQLFIGSAIRRISLPPYLSIYHAGVCEKNIPPETVILGQYQTDESILSTIVYTDVHTAILHKV